MNDNLGKMTVAKPTAGMAKSKGETGKKEPTPAKKGGGMSAAVASTDYATRDDARTLVQAHIIKGDKKRHEKAKAHIAAHVNAMKNAASEQSNETGYAGPNTNGDSNAGNLGV